VSRPLQEVPLKLSPLWQRKFSRLSKVLVAAVLAIVGWAVIPGSSLQYLLIQGYFQLEMLAGREPIQTVLTRDGLDQATRQKLEKVLDIRDFGAARLGMAAGGNYSTINLHWSRELWNVTASEELAFRPKLWWFPIVGSIPYKGFFARTAAEAEGQGLQALGLDVAVRPVGAYSTLGWFNDPLLPSMLDLEEAELANLILHELTHATVFIPGRIDFNEQLASFVARVATTRYLEARHGRGSPEVLALEARRRDGERVETFMVTFSKELDDVYQQQIPDDEKRRKKASILEGAAARFAALPFESETLRSRPLRPLNNADLLQYRRYSSRDVRFDQLLDLCQSDFDCFWSRLRELSREGGDPFDALSRAVQTPPP
jgi:predicted aminopeptidase